MALRSGLLALAASAATAATFDHQMPLLSPSASDEPGYRTLRGRFLHITDIHPDPFYKVYSSTSEDGACHRGKGPAGAYGAETSDCDTPYSLVNATFTWIAENLADKIDFVVWTGDSARHDNDDEYPRSHQTVVEQNQMLVDRMHDVFGSSRGGGGGGIGDYVVPIVPTFGNNDILPHNIFGAGPNQWTQEYARVWHDFVPEEQRHQFDRGGWFYVEVIPSRLAVFSLNTMYFFSSNAAVDGCIRSEPGGEQFQWLRIQLQLLRLRGMKAILTGHVPPARSEDEGGKTSWDETCWQKYALWLRQYRDVVVGSMYGHMNYEHFLLQDFHDIEWKIAAADLDVSSSAAKDDLAMSQTAWKVDGQESSPSASEKQVDVMGVDDYLKSLRKQWRRLPDVSSMDKAKHVKREIGGEWAERYSMSYVSASVVPNYFPTLRVVEYNISGLEHLKLPHWNAAQSARADTYRDEIDLGEDARLSGGVDGQDTEDAGLSEGEYNQDTEDVGLSKHKKHKKKKHRKKKKQRRPDFTVPDGPSKISPPGPAYSPQTLSLLGYTQFFANLTAINNDFTNASYTAYNASRTQPLHDEDALYSPPPSADLETINEWGEDGYVDASRWRPGKHHPKHPRREAPRPREFDFRVEYDTADAGDIYNLGPKRGGLVVRNFVDLASRIGKARPGNSIIPTDGAEDEAEEVDETQAEEEAEADESEHTESRKKKKKHHKKKKHRKHRGKGTKAWYAFVDRATVATLDPGELLDRFSLPADAQTGLSDGRKEESRDEEDEQRWLWECGTRAVEPVLDGN